MKKLFLLLALYICGPLAVLACTSIIITGRATPDGRPLMWKHRDTGAPYNHIRYFDGEGFFMRRALEVCASLGDFEHYLDTLSRPMRVEANFGVIDAQGGAAYYETNNNRYYKKDVNDSSLAPEDTPNNRTGWFVEQDFIPRQESTASIVIQGVKRGMKPELTTMWTSLGYPPASVAVPLWVKMGKNQPSWLLYDEKYKAAPLDWHSVELKKKVYSIHRGNGQKYMRWSLLWNDEGTDYIQRLLPVENRLFTMFDNHKREWERKGLDMDEIHRLYGEVDVILSSAFRDMR